MSNNPSIDSLSNSDVATSELRVERVRHAFGARHMQLMSREIVSPGFMRLTLGGADLSDFNSAGFDDHVKLLLPANPPGRWPVSGRWLVVVGSSWPMSRIAAISART